MSWSIEGPKGRAKAHANVRAEAGENGRSITLEVVLPNGKKVLLNAAGDNEAPRLRPEGRAEQTRSQRPPAGNQSRAARRRAGNTE